MAIDGSKFKAVNNRDKNFTQAKLQRLVMTSARAEQPQVCLIDIGLPELDGNQVAQRLPEMADAVLIAVRDMSRIVIGKAPWLPGFDRRLIKPVDTKYLAAILNAIAIP